MEDSKLTPIVVARIVLKAQNRAAADKAKADRDCDEIRQRKDQFRAHSAKRRETRRSDIEEGEIEEEEESNTFTASTLPTSPGIITPFQRLPTPVASIKELCPTFCTTGSCTAICPRIHDPDKISICPSVLQGRLCAGLASARCRLNHNWTFKIAPTCANYLMGRCCATPCPYAHHDFVSTFSPICEQFSKVGYCEGGHECHEIHWRGPMPEAVEAVEQKAGKDVIERKLEVAKAKVKESMMFQVSAVPGRTARGDEKVARRRLSDTRWRKKPEEVVRGETTGELALQEDFVPF